MIKGIEYDKEKIYKDGKALDNIVRDKGYNITITLTQEEMDNIYEELEDELGKDGKYGALAILGQYGIDIIGAKEDYGDDIASCDNVNACTDCR
jgi:glucuronate isomerase